MLGIDSILTNLDGAVSAMDASSWSITGFLTNLNTSLFKWGSILVVIIGIVMVIVGVFNIAKGLMSGGRTQTNWVVNLLLFFLGGALAFTNGWNLVQDISHGGYSTLQELGGETGGGFLISSALYEVASFFGF